MCEAGAAFDGDAIMAVAFRPGQPRGRRRSLP